MYYEASNSYYYSTSSVLTSPSSTMIGKVCIKFAYHLYGSGISTFNVYYRVKVSWYNYDYRILYKRGNQGDFWDTFEKNLTFSTTTHFQVLCLLFYFLY